MTTIENRHEIITASVAQNLYGVNIGQRRVTIVGKSEKFTKDNILSVLKTTTAYWETRSNFEKKESSYTTDYINQETELLSAAFFRAKEQMDQAFRNTGLSIWVTN